MEIMHREELAWAAGFFDGEGHVGVVYQGEAKFPCLKIEVSQKDRRALDRFQAATGGFGNIYTVNRKKGDPYFNWATGKFEHAQQVIICLWQWLSPVKREQAKTALLKVKEGYLSGRFENRKTV